MKALSAAELDERSQAPARSHQSRLITLSFMTAGWGFWYAMYRAYYGFGGTAGMFGVPKSESQWRAINLAGAAILLLVAALPVAILPLWKRSRVRPILLGLCWLLAVGFTMHALVDDIQRILSLAGLLHLDYPLFMTVNSRVADLQDLIFNETWFLAEGVLWGILGWIDLHPSPARRWWIGTAVAAVVVLTCIGLLAGFGLIGRFIIG